MAYVISFKKDKVRLYLPAVAEALAAFVAKDGRFTCNFIPTGTDCEYNLGDYIKVECVRLAQAKPYCGQHPGVCENPSRPKPRMRYLKWDDWVSFNNLVNAGLDAQQVGGDMWSNPREQMDKGAKMWLRRAGKTRQRYDYETTYRYGRPFQTWNHGSQDQFA
ncbi:MAG: hypothetical protein A2Y38_17025 [Spirochaetes bacterium GWB1_59_5]|nr:MAG: hypothetical protein A2Y38_17025 [Spirochaetes bacterium GWB1_59_5]